MMSGCAFRRALFMVLCVLVPMTWPLTASPAVASTVVPMNASTLAGHAGQVIVGEVASVRSYWADAPRRIETLVVFEKVVYLKGRLVDSSERFSLVVPGGVVGKIRMRLCCAPVFIAGERHLLLLLPSYKTFPTVGLGQGDFRLITDADGVDRVYQQGIAVTGFDAEGFVRFASGVRPSAHDHVIAGDRARLAVRPPSAATGSAKAIRYKDFLSHLRPILAASRDHKLTEPAGKRVLVELRPVPLKTSPAARPAGKHRSIRTVHEEPSGKPRGRRATQESSVSPKNRPDSTTRGEAKP